MVTFTGPFHWEISALRLSPFGGVLSSAATCALAWLLAVISAIAAAESSIKSLRIAFSLCSKMMAHVRARATHAAMTIQRGKVRPLFLDVDSSTSSLHKRG